MTSARAGISATRKAGPQPMTGTIAPDTPPEAPEPQPVPLMRALMPLIMVVAVVGMVVLMFVSGMGRNPMSFMFPLMMVFSTVGMMVSGGAGNKDMAPARKDYQRHLSSIRRAVAKAARMQRESAQFIHPRPGTLWQLGAMGRACERRKGDPDFLQLRIGVATQQPATPVTPPAIPAPEKLDPVSAVALREVIRSARQVEGVPFAIDVSAFEIIALTGDTAAQGLARAMVAQAAALHHPEDCLIAVVGDGWEWLKWTPHHGHPAVTDACGSARLRAATCAQLTELLTAIDTLPAAVLIVLADSSGQLDVTELTPIFDAAGSETSVVLLTVVEAQSTLWEAAVNHGIALVVSTTAVHAETASGREEIGVPDQLSPAEAEVLGRSLARFEVPTSADDSVKTSEDPVMEELGLYPPPATLRYRPRYGSARLRIPVGADDGGAPVYLDFKESAEGGMGPHGLCVGATGSGKSEFLRTTVVGLAATHSPDQLNFVLVDFKGGATFLGLDQLPHVSAVITNLEQELILVNRMEDALRGEMTRRQEQLRAAGNFAGVSDYEQARRAGQIDAPPMPALLIVVDEFSELLSARPEFAELFVAIGRLGRSLHMHLLLASQRLEEGRLRGLESHLSYRIGLKTFSVAESRSVLGVPDAYHLPAIPGIGYIKSAAAEPVRFRSAYVSGPVVRPQPVDGAAAGAEQGLQGQVAAVAEFTAENWTREAFGASSSDGGMVDPPVQTSEQTVLGAVVAAVSHVPTRAHRVWLPPLPEAIELQPDEQLPRQRLTGVIGLVDKPLFQRQDPLRIDLRTTGGHVAIVGAPRSGKTTAARTAVLALADGISARDLHFYIVDCGAGGLSDLAELPHVASVAHRGDEELIRRTLGFLRREVSRREQLFRTNGWLSSEAARAAGQPDSVLVIDGWGAFKTEFPALSDDVQALVADGLAVGIHVLLTAHRWTDMRPAVRDLIGTRIELRQAESMDSMIDRKAAELVPESPGRGVAPGGFAMLVALTGAADTKRIVETVPHGEQAPKLQLLPRRIDIARLPRPAAATRGAIAVGLEEAGLGAVIFHPEKDRHLLIFGSAGSGRTAALRGIVHQLRYSQSDSKFVVIDYRRGLMEAVPQERLAGYAGSAAVATPMLAELAEVLKARLPQPDITPAQLKARNWWSGPTINVIVDDYDLVAGSRGNPLQPLAEVIAHAADIGLNIFFARRISGALRSLHDPVMGAVKDQGASVFVMDGTRDDGPILGVKPCEQPPGRGYWVAHGQSPQVVQLGWLDTAGDQEDS